MSLSPALAILASTPALVLTAAASAATVPVSEIPTTSDTVQGFAPQGWKVEKTVRADLDRDGDRDAAVVLVQDPNAGPAYGVYDGSRALVLALRQSNGQLKRSGVAPRLLGCKECGGAFTGPGGLAPSVRFQGGNVVVEQEFGAREVTVTLHRLRWLSGPRRFRLVGLDTSLRDRATGSALEVSTNYLTGRQIRIQSANGRVTSRTTRRVAIAPRPIGGLVFGSTRP